MKAKTVVTFLAGLVTGILAVLAYVAPKPDAYARARAEGEMRALALACHAYHQINSRWPAALADLAPENGERIYYPVTGRSQRGIDPWGHSYVFRPPSSAQTFATLISYGADGSPGGSGINADIEFHLTDQGISQPWINR